MTINNFNDFDTEIQCEEIYNDSVPYWIENEDGSGQWSDGWTGEDDYLDRHLAIEEGMNDELINDDGVTSAGYEMLAEMEIRGDFAS